MTTAQDIPAAPIEPEDPYGIRTDGHAGLDGARVLKDSDTFAVFDRAGDIPARSAGTYGLFHDGTRFLSSFGLRLGGNRLLLLSSGVSDDNVLTIDLTNGDLWADGQLAIPHGTVHVSRTIFLWHGVCHERLRITNFGTRAVELDLRLDFAADFRDLFELRGMARLRRGRLTGATVEHDAVVLGYVGLDDVRRATRIELAPAPARVEANTASFRLQLEAKESKCFELGIACEVGESKGRTCTNFDHARAEAFTQLSQTRGRTCRVETSNARFDEFIDRARADLEIMITQTEHGPYPYAGVPWFSAAFGRDGIITALLVLWSYPELARGVLRFLAAHQADAVDDSRDAEPGKIVHEMRGGEMATLREIPFGKYYGSVDSTPLFILLLGEYARATADLGLVRELWPNLERALEWIERWGDCDFDGFVEYGARARDGLVQQGWKDSHDSVFHADGSSAEGPIALAEVQGYVYAAWRAAAELCAALGDHDGSKRWDRRADELRVQFDEAFWCDELGCWALALDGKKRPCRVRTSNAGQCLFTGIALPKRVAVVADTMLADDMFSGWGVRTLSTRERRYNPLSYHNGSVWPHDNALVALGLARHGFSSHALRILEGMFDASQSFDLHRMPELFCGFARRPGEGPTLYPVACSPQAWAAAAPFGLLGAVLGLCVRAEPPLLEFQRPVLPPFLEEVVLKDLRVGGRRVSVRLHRYPEDVGVNVFERSGPLEIIAVK